MFQEKIASLREQLCKLKALEVAVHAAPDKRISLTDPDARSIARRQGHLSTLE